MSSRYQELCRSLESAREQFAAYRSECAFFAAVLSRGIAEYAGWPRELVCLESLGSDDAGRAVERIEDAMHLDSEGFYHLGLRLALEVPKGRDSIQVKLRFKKLEKNRYIISLFDKEDFEVGEPTPDALQPIYDAILNAVKRHYDFGLRLFLENGGRGLKIPISTQRLLEMAKGAGGAT